MMGIAMRHSALLIGLALCASCSRSPPSVTPPGAPETPKTNVLEAGAKVLQPSGPVGKLDIYLVGFHPMKDAPDEQMEAHHYCQQVNEDLAQCALYDGNTDRANLTGIEYIISETLFAQLPAHERNFWHPHNGEILSGQLSAPNLPQVAEKELMRSKINSYGKTWHTWHSRKGTAPGDTLPLGEPMLAWSFNRDGELQQPLIAQRDQAVSVSTAERRANRQELVPLAKPQEGVDALRAHFPIARPIPGVTDARGNHP
ncbi:OBAP family protein [Xanthomonas campestris pv. pennamericanum]|uniref:OBAP family protein n=1 Tax=Xanthomonas euvesicatoria TaxID=456327 RepID=UPI001C45021D|nr:OBAP family protein [Xanthomonas euvesicatoria]MBV6809356.1 OBAP family protein [Xanthomonas campestris pv. pennamericanum]